MKRKKYWEMTADELAATTKYFDESNVIATSRPLRAQERKKWQRIKRRGRPTIGQGHKRISVSIERGLLRKITALAKKRHISRSRLFAQVLEEALAQDGGTEQ
jgi:hypothetical protein